MSTDLPRSFINISHVPPYHPRGCLWGISNSSRSSGRSSSSRVSNNGRHRNSVSNEHINNNNDGNGNNNSNDNNSNSNGHKTNNKNENDKLTEYKDTIILHKSTIKEKELCIDFDKKSFQPCEKRIFIKKFNNLKSDIFKKKSLVKYYTSNCFIERYFLSKNTMIHYLFNNIFFENPNNTSNQNNNQENFKFLIDEENDLVLLSILDIYDKSQKLFAVGGKNQDYADIVNYIEINLVKPNILLMKNKLIVIRYKCLFISLQLEIYDDKNILSNILSNNSFFSEIENLFSLCHNTMFNSGA